MGFQFVKKRFHFVNKVFHWGNETVSFPNETPTTSLISSMNWLDYDIL